MHMLVLCLLSCGAKPPVVAAPDPSNNQGYTATIERTGNSWAVHYRFGEDRTAVLFDTNHGSYRVDRWTPVDEGAQLLNLDGLDGLFFEAPTRQVRLQISPPEGRYEGTLPFLNFSDGSSAFYAGQLALLTVDDLAAARALRGDLSKWRGEQPPVEVWFTSDQPIVTDAPDPVTSARATAHHGAGPYLYDGPIRAVRSDTSLSVLDPGLPGWLADQVPKDLTAVDRVLARLWDQDLPAPVYLLAWAGPEDPWSNVGRAEGRQITMTLRGSRYQSADPAARQDLVWFFAHERAHHFQLAPGVAIADTLLEGAADAMAADVLHDLGLLTPDGQKRRSERVRESCVHALGEVAFDQVRGKGAAACGEVLAELTGASLPDGDLYGFWRAMLQLAEGQDARVDTSFYLYALSRSGASSRASELIEALVSGRYDSASEAMDQAYDELGTAHPAP